MKRLCRLQMTQPTSGGAVTAVTNCCANCVEPSRPQQCWPDIPSFGKPAMRMVGAALHKSGWCRDESRSDNSNKRVCICDICYKQIHVMKQISIMCNRIDHWVHLRRSSIRQAQYTDTRTCNLHREYRLTTHTDITSPHPSRPWSKQWVDNNNNKRFSSYEKSLPLPGRMLLRRGW